jgi:serine/threonine protein kinase
VEEIIAFPNSTRYNVSSECTPSGTRSRDLETLHFQGEDESVENSSGLDETILPKGAILQDRYEIITVLGLGGMGAVYQARDLRFTGVARLCALKEMTCTTPDPQVRRLAIQNFEREANILASLNHPAIPKIYDYFSEGIRSYLALEYIDGEDLEALMGDTEQMLPQEQVVDF